MAKLFRYMGRYKFRFILMFIFAVAGTVFSIVGPKILGKATTEPLKSFAFSPDIIRPCPPIGPLLLCSLMPVPPLITEILQSADIPHNLPSVPYEFQCLPYVRRPVQ